MVTISLDGRYLLKPLIQFSRIVIIVQANIMRLDPAKIAGPLETAFQDIVGQSFLLGVSYAIFSVTEHRM